MDHNTPKERASKICAALNVIKNSSSLMNILEFDGVDAALRVIDRWMDILAEKHGKLDVDVKEAAYAYVKTLKHNIRSSSSSHRSSDRSTAPIKAGVLTRSVSL